MSSESTPPIAVGTVIGGKFRITGYLGSGGMARVYEAENVDIGKRIAVKVLSSELIGSRTVTQRFVREARAAARIRSPYICDVFDVGTYDEQPFLVMELLEGESLYDLLARERRLKPEQAYRIASQIARGLQRAHDEGVIHRDLKPENIFLARSDDQTRIAKIVDFGLAKFHEPNLEGGDQARLTRDGALFGTPAFMSPEQAEAKGDVGFQSDLWSLGCIVYEMLTGRTVWNVDQGVAMILAQIAGGKLPVPSKTRRTLPESFDTWFARALARDPRDRFASAMDFADQLKTALGLGDLDSALAQPIPSPPPRVLSESPPAVEMKAASAMPAPSARPARRFPTRRHLTWITAGGLVALLGIGALLFRKLGPRFLTSRPDPTLEAASLPPPAETIPIAAAISAAQELLLTAPERGVEGLKKAFDDSQHKAARSLFSQASAAVTTPSGPCRVLGIGHPREFDAKAESSKPSIGVTRFGIVSVWADNHESAAKRQVYSTLLDPALRRVYPVQSATPELVGARHPQLFHTADGLGLLYWESGGEQAGIYVRRLELDGKIGGPPILLSKNKSANYFPAITSDPDGGYWVSWSEPTSKHVSDLMALRLSSALEPVGNPVRVTAYAPSNAFPTVAGRPALATGNGLLHIAYSLERHNQEQVFVVRVDPKRGDFSQGGVQAVDAKVTGTADEENDRFLGQVIQLSPPRKTAPGEAPKAEGGGQEVQASVACAERGCFVVWEEQAGGAWASFIEHKTGEIVWRKAFAPAGARAAIGQFDEDLAVAWFEDKRVKLATLASDGVGEASGLGRVSSPRFEAAPQLAPGSAPGDWYLTWRDYEVGVHEPFVLHASCGATGSH